MYSINAGADAVVPMWMLFDDAPRICGFFVPESMMLVSWFVCGSQFCFRHLECTSTVSCTESVVSFAAATAAAVAASLAGPSPPSPRRP